MLREHIFTKRRALALCLAPEVSTPAGYASPRHSSINRVRRARVAPVGPSRNTVVSWDLMDLGVGSVSRGGRLRGQGGRSAGTATGGDADDAGATNVADAGVSRAARSVEYGRDPAAGGRNPVSAGGARGRTGQARTDTVRN